jgi:hypothetical protein
METSLPSRDQGLYQRNKLDVPDHGRTLSPKWTTLLSATTRATRR